MVLFIMNAARYTAAPADVFASIYEAKQALTTVQKQRFVEWFSGDALDSIWTQTNSVGTGTFGMQDDIDGDSKLQQGLQLITGVVLILTIYIIMILMLV